MRKRIDKAMSWRRRTKEERTRYKQLGINAGGDATELCLYNHNISDDRACKIARSLQKNSHVKILNLSCNHIGDGGCCALAKAIQDNFTLQRVQLGGNCMGSQGILALSSSLKYRECPIEALSLPDNEIDDNGVRAVATSLQSNVNLRELFLHGNRIGSAGVTCLASALRQNQTLKSLDLSNNCIGDDGARALSEALVDNTSLTTLILGDNRLSSDGLQHFVNLLEQNCTLLLLDTHLQACSNEYRRFEETISFYTSLNQYGRGVLRRHGDVILSLLLEHVNKKPDVLYGLLRDCPHLWI